MLKMIKWTFWGAGAIAGALALLFGTDGLSYGATLLSQVRSTARGAVPVSFELARIEGLLLEVEPELLRCRQDLARSEVATERLHLEVTELEQGVAEGEAQLRRGAEAVATVGAVGEVVVVQAAATSRRVPALRRLLEQVKADKARLLAKQTQLAQGRAAADAARQQMVTVVQEQQKLRDQLAALRVQKLEVEAMASASPLQPQLDTGALAAARRGLAELQERLDVDRRVFRNEIATSLAPGSAGDSATEVLADIETLFGGKPIEAVRK